MMVAFIICQTCIVLFIGLHDWLPLGRLNNLHGIRAVDGRTQLVLTTLVSVLPFAIGLAGTIDHALGHFPLWLVWFLWITYGLGLYGMLRAWYWPYLVQAQPMRADRYQQRFADTHAFLPVRHGIRPDTLHVVFHAVLLLTVSLLAALTFSGRLAAG